MKTQPATGETYPKSDLFNKAAWSLLAGFSRRIVEPLHQGRAMAIAMAGTPLALSLGVPLGTWLGHYLGWRLTFGIMSVLSLLL
ncbi:MFS transporter, partial [Enterobacter hormaechei subsp. hoffmannii]